VTADFQEQGAQLGLALFASQAGASLLLASVLAGLHRVYSRPFLACWAAAWLALGLSTAGMALGALQFGASERDWARLATTTLVLAAGYGHVAGLFAGTWALATGRAPGRFYWRALVPLVLVLGLAAALRTADLEPGARAIARTGALGLATGLAFLAAGLAVAGPLARERSVSRGILAVLFVAGGLVQLDQFLRVVRYPGGIAADSLVVLVAPHAFGLLLQFLLLAGLLWWFFAEERAVALRAQAALAASEEQRRRVEHMESVGRLAGGVAHDFNNLLTAIRGHAESLLARTQPGDPDREDLLPIARATARAAELVRHLLTFSRRQPLRPQRFVLDELLASRERTLSRLAGENVRLVLQLGAPGAVLHADPAQIEMVVINLVTNARDAVRGRGELRIATRALELAPDASSLAAGPYVELEVHDDGCGIPRELQHKIFEPFFTTKPGQGTGLGLSSVYGVIEVSRGAIRVESEPGRGSTFRIWLPRVSAAPEARDELVPVAPAAGGNETILLAEDEDLVRHIAQRSLTRAGYRVLAATNGEHALEVLRATSEPVHLLLSDVVMPGLTLEELLAGARALRPELRVLLMSGYTEAAVGRQGVDPAFADFLQKPYDSGELLAAVRAALDRPPATRGPRLQASG
jgi:signal transduction histidine kinase/CheY-like chemotaxis protein